jgi:hypothetical protein
MISRNASFIDTLFDHIIPISMIRWKYEVYLILAVCFLLGSGTSARAFTTDEANLSWQTFKNHFWYTVSSTRGYFREHQQTGATVTTYKLAYVIEAAIDARDTTVVHQSIDGFIALYGTNPASWDPAEDDNMTFALVFAEAYRLTGKIEYLNMARDNFDTSYNRAWDPVNGGLYRAIGDVKSAQVNAPGCLAAYIIYSTGGGGVYLTKARNIYNWMLANVWNSSTGQVNAKPGDTQNPLSADASYFAACSYFLGYPGNATKAGNFVKNRWGTGMQGFGPNSFLGSVNSINLRWLARINFDRPFLQACVDRGWACRNASGLVGPDFNQVTPNSNAYAYDCTNIVAGMMCVTPGGGPTGYTYCASENQSFNFSQTVDVAYGADGSFNYRNNLTGTVAFNNANFGDPIPGVVKGGYYRNSSGTTFALFVRSTGQALDASGAGTANGTPIIQSTYHGGNNQRWNVTPLSNGQYNAIGVASGRCLEVNGYSQNNNAAVDLWDYIGANNQKFTQVSQDSGYYNIVFVHSGKAMEVLNNSSANGAAIVQYTLGAHGYNAQWQFRTP